jgi:hypothetical protein
VDAISEVTSSLFDCSSHEVADRLLEAMTLFGAEPLATFPAPSPSLSLAFPAQTSPAAPTFLATIAALPRWQIALLALGVGVGLGWGLAAVFGVKATTAAAIGAAAL